jgi:hypothetical protein
MQLNESILLQQALMTKATGLLKEMEYNENIFGGIDDDYVKKENAILQNRYADTMTQLTKHLSTVTGFTLVSPVKINENVVSIAEQKYAEVI